MELENIAEKIDSANHAFEEFKKTNEDNLKKRDVLHEEKMKNITDEIAEVMEQKQRLDRIEAAMNRTVDIGNGESKADEQKHEYKEAFLKFAKKGHVSDALMAGPAEYKDLQVSLDPNGGYWVTPEMASFVVDRIFETSPVRGISNVVTISTDSLDIIVDDNEAASGGWVGETASRSDTATPDVGKRNIPTHEHFAQPKATQKILDDASINIEQWLAGKIADKLGREENTAFVSGNGVSKPRGFTDYPAWASAGTYERDAIEQVNSGSAGAVTADGLLDLQNSLIETYQANATFVMKRATFGDVAKLKDQNDNYLFNRALDTNVGTPFMLLSRPVVFMDDMPGVASDALAIGYGDFNRGYTVVDRLGIRTIRDDLTDKPYIKFYSVKRVGGDVTNFEAIKLQKLAV